MAEDIQEDMDGENASSLNLIGNDTKRMFENIALSKASIKSQQRDETEQSTSQRIQVLEELFLHSAAAFLERFHPYLCEDDLDCFEHATDSYEVTFYLKEVRKRLAAGKASVVVKNRRYEALKKLEKEGSYFTDDAMRTRDPLMYEQLVGQYMTDEELTESRKTFDPTDLKFSTILMTFLEDQQTKALKQRQQDMEDAAEEEEEEEDEDEEDEEDNAMSNEGPSSRDKHPGQKAQNTKQSEEDSEEEEMEDDDDDPTFSFRHQPTPATEEEKQLLREEFCSHMRERFLSGQDQDFDYEAVDNNAEYDSLAIRGWDEEEKYFDEEDPLNLSDGEGSRESAKCGTDARTGNEEELDDYEKWTPESEGVV